MKQILVVDDEQAIGDVIAALLVEEGYDVILAQNGRAALNALTSAAPQLIITDLMMPVMSGLELCRALHTHPRFNSVPIILMSAAMEQPRNTQCPYTAFLPKPFDFTTFLNLVSRLLDDRP